MEKAVIIGGGRIWHIRSWLWLFVALVSGSGFLARAQNPAPILVVTNSADPFSGYYSEILLAEGLNEFTLAGYYHAVECNVGAI